MGYKVILKRRIKTNKFGDLMIMCNNKLATPLNHTKFVKGNEVIVSYDTDNENITIVFDNQVKEEWERW